MHPMNRIRTQDQRKAIQAAGNLLEQKPIYIDTETTGLGKEDEIIEIAIIEHDGTVLFNSLCKPTRSIPPEAVRINHITDEMVKDKPSWVVIWQKIRPLLFGRIIGMYNAEFDYRMMKQTHQKYNLEWKDNLRVFDIMKLYAMFRGEIDPIRRQYKFFSLEAAGKMAGIPIPNSHRAVDDTLLARALLHHIANSDADRVGDK